MVVLVACYLVACLLRIGITFFVIHPQSLPDEYYYDYVSRMFLDGSLFFGSSPYPSQYPPFYSIAISIGHVLSENAYSSYKFILMWNCIVSSLIVFPTYAILKRFTSGFYPLAGAVLVLMLPSITASNLMLMSENIFTLLIILTFFYFLKSLDYDHTSWSVVILGMLLFLSLFTRTTGIALTIGYITAMAVLGYLNRDTPIVRTIGVKLILGLGTMVFLYGAWGIDQIWTKGMIGGGYNISFVQIGSIIFNKPLLFLHTFILEIQYLFIASFVIFFIFSLWFIASLFSEGEENREEGGRYRGYETGIGTFITVSSVALFLIGISFIFGIIQNQVPYVYGRYVDPLTPLVIILGTIGISRWGKGKILSLNRFKNPLYLTVFLATVGGFLITLQQLPEPNNNSAIFFWYNLVPTISWVIVAIIPVLIASAFLYLGRKPFGHQIFYMVCIVLAILSSIPIIQWEVDASKQFSIALQLNDKINTITPENDVILWENPKSTDAWDLITYHALKYWMQKKLTRSNLTIIQQNDGRIAISSDSDISSKWVISQNDYPLKKVMTFGNYRLYTMSG